MGPPYQQYQHGPEINPQHQSNYPYLQSQFNQPNPQFNQPNPQLNQANNHYHNHPIPNQYHNGHLKFVPNQPVIIPAAVNPMQPQHIIFQPITSHQFTVSQQVVKYQQQIPIGLYQRHRPNESNNFMCLRKNVQLKRELDIEEDEPSKVVLKDYPKCSTSYTGPSISMITINIPINVFKILLELLSKGTDADIILRHKDDHWVFSFLSKICDNINWNSKVQKNVPVKFVDVGKGDMYNRILVRSDGITNCCLPFELAKSTPPCSFVNKNTTLSVLEDKHLNSTITYFDTCKVSSPNFDFITSLLDCDKLNVQKCLIDCTYFGALDYCTICKSKQENLPKISISLENWIDNDRFALVIRCFRSQIPSLLDKIAKNLS